MSVVTPVVRRFFIELAEPTFERLAALASAERREPRDQAAIVLEELLNMGRPAPSVRGRRRALNSCRQAAV